MFVGLNDAFDCTALNLDAHTIASLLGCRAAAISHHFHDQLVR